MDFLSTRAERLAGHIREGIRQARWREPLPTTRDWARRLGVARNTLAAALALLKKDGTLRVEPRQGIRLGRARKARAATRRTRLVRIVYYGLDFNEVTASILWWAGTLSEQLGERQIHLSVERCSDKQLRRICGEGARRDESIDELLLPLSVPARHQRLLQATRRPAVHLGGVASGVDLPFVTCDVAGAVAHAAHHLLRNGFRKLTLIQTKTHNPGVGQTREGFLSACRRWPHQPIDVETLLLPTATDEKRLSLNRFVNRIKARQGILTDALEHVVLLVTMLLSRGIAVPSQVELTAVDCVPEMVSVHPPLTYYPFPRDAFVKTVARAAIHFFATGALPPLRQVLPLERVAPFALARAATAPGS